MYLKDFRIIIVNFILLYNMLYADNLSDDILSDIKKKSLTLQSLQNEARSSKLKKDWLNPIVLSWKYKKDDDYTTKTIALHIDQPIFKSGGIYQAIKYANSMKNYGQSSLKITENKLIVNAYNILFNIKKMDFSIQKQKLLIQNAKIDVNKKEELVNNGLLDSTFLNNAILDKNFKQNTLFDMELSRQTLINSFKNISQKDYKTFVLPNLKLISNKEYINNNILLKNDKENIENKNRYYKMTISKYLPSINLYLDKTKYISSTNPILDDSSTQTFYGLKASILFDTRTLNDIQNTKLDYLRAQNDLIDKKEEQKNFYQDILFRLNILNKKIALSEEDIKLYAKLVKEFDEQFKAGLKTKDDLEMMKNSKKIKELDKKIYNIEKNIELLKLYENIQNI